MSPLLHAELRKVRATPVIWWLLLAAAALGAISTYLTVALSDAQGAALLTDSNVQEAMHGASIGSVLVAVAGIIGMAGEWRFGQVSQTFLTTAQRSLVVGAKAVVYTGIGLLYGVVASASATATAWGAYRGEGVTLPLERSAVWLTLLGVIAAAGLLALLGLAVGSVVRNQVIAIVATLAWFFLLEPVVYAASMSIARWLPGMASAALARMPEDGNLSPGLAAMVLAGIVAIGLALGMRLTEREDVTA
jgi:ABC-2 type transport system permease protein